MKKSLIIVAFVTLMLSITAVNANSTTSAFDGTATFTGSFAPINPCNGEKLNGPIEIHLVVTTAQTGNGGIMVNVHHSSHGVLSGNLGNEYEVSRTAKGRFDAFSNSYVIPWRGEFVGKGTAPNFVAEGTLRVIVNTNNDPIGSQLVMMNATCSQ
jgi:hypothetical protein